MKKIIILFGIILTGLLFYSCEKEPYPVYKMSQEFKDYVVFQKGSFWVYEDSASGKLDTVRVIEAHTKLDNNDDLKTNTEVYFCDYSHTSGFSNGNLNSGIAKGWGRHAGKDINEYNYFIDLNYFFVSNISVGADLGVYRNLSYEKLIDTSWIEGIKYTSVRVFSKPNSSNLQITKIFFSGKIGIVRKELKNGEIWNLKTYQVFQ